MKKTISILLALVLMMSLSVTAFATEYDAAPVDAEAEITATYVAGGAGGTVFSIEIEWSEMAFEYQAAKWAQWDPETHSYSEPIKASWSGEGTITITNHSNVALDVTPGYEMDAAFTNTKLTFKDGDTVIDGTLVVASAADTNAEVVKTITVKPEGKLASSASGKIGVVTVTVDASENVSLETVRALKVQMYALQEELENDRDKVTFGAYIVALEGAIGSFEQELWTQEQLNKAYNDALKEYNIYMDMA